MSFKTIDWAHPALQTKIQKNIFILLHKQGFTKDKETLYQLGAMYKVIKLHNRHSA